MVSVSFLLFQVQDWTINVRTLCIGFQVQLDIKCLLVGFSWERDEGGAFWNRIGNVTFKHGHYAQWSTLQG